MGLSASVPSPLVGTAWSVPAPGALEALVSEARALQPFLVETRRACHRIPELGWLEFETTGYIESALASMGYKPDRGSSFLGAAPRLGLPPAAEGGTNGDTGCVALTRCPRPGPTVALRFDIDALPIPEAGPPHRPSTEGWASQRPGAMHACGHDGHIAIGLGVARLLAPRLKDGRGTLKLIFQPAEEGTRGAKAAVEAGHLDDVDLFLGLHLGFGVRSGAVALGTHGFLATRKFAVTYVGAPAHAGKEPEAGRNALLAAAQAVLGLHALAQHSQPGVRVNVGKLEAGLAANIVPDRATMQLELRAPTQETLDILTERAITLIEGTASAHDLSCQVTLTGEATDATTDHDIAEWAAALARSASLFTDFEMNYSFGGSEDATLMMRRVQEHGGRAGYFVLGSDLSSAHHTSSFDFDESSLSAGLALLSLIAASALDLW